MKGKHKIKVRFENHTTSLSVLTLESGVVLHKIPTFCSFSNYIETKKMLRRYDLDNYNVSDT